MQAASKRRNKEIAKKTAVRIYFSISQSASRALTSMGWYLKAKGGVLRPPYFR